MIRLIAPLAFVSCLLFALGICAQRPATISGIVYYGDNSAPAKNVEVSLSDSEHVDIESQNTNEEGQFRFTGLKRSTYTLNVEVSGYERVRLDVDVSIGSDRGMAIYLKPISKKQDSPTSNTVSAHELSMPAKARELMESGNKKLFQNKDTKGALADFQQALAIAPTYYEAAYEIAMTQLTLGNRDVAETSFRKSFQLSSDTFADASAGLGGVLLDRNDLHDAEQSIRKGLELNPNLWLAHYELGRFFLMQNQLPAALASAERARVLAPRSPVVYRLLSNIHLLQKNYPALLADLDTYLTLDPDSSAGIRAKQLRDQTQQKLSADQLAPASTKP